MQIRSIQQNNLYTKNTNQLNYKSFNGTLKNSPSFKGNAASQAYNKLTDVLAVGINKIVDTETFAKFTKKVADIGTDNWFPSIIAAEAIWLSGFYALSAYQNPKYEKKQKQTEAVYQTLSSIFCAVGAFSIDKVVNEIMERFAKTFEKNYNQEAMAKLIAKDSEALDKCKNGVKQLKSIVIFTTIYRFVGPVLMNPVANKISGHFQDKANEKKQVK